MFAAATFLRHTASTFLIVLYSSHLRRRYRRLFLVILLLGPLVKLLPLLGDARDQGEFARCFSSSNTSARDSLSSSLTSSALPVNDLACAVPFASPVVLCVGPVEFRRTFAKNHGHSETLALLPAVNYPPSSSNQKETQRSWC